ncbi:hypothetical protein KDA_19890 [Dictyobacter alpinus]|uniref:Uncharacterized protein n=1 Tax=Dictyobacter alpinus TaxID=2014873 RepID=A0A402B592_9CHLR|nr:hypothetical protein KDA_19890 [Dictyobacter alpinus]
MEKNRSITGILSREALIPDIINIFTEEESLDPPEVAQSSSSF